jgi:pSer/pThr/pTyr-binding forkhead associated (FHA) protein
MDRQPVLVVTKGPIEGARFPVEADGLTLGRDEECSVVLDDPNVSRFHARLVFHNASIWVQDAGSRNGVFLNGKRVVRHKQLGPGDELLIGDHGFTLELEMPAPQPSLTGTIVATSEVKSNRLLVLAACAVVLVFGLLIWLGTS